jgi:hypothetical protein
LAKIETNDGASPWVSCTDVKKLLLRIMKGGVNMAVHLCIHGWKLAELGVADTYPTNIHPPWLACLMIQSERAYHGLIPVQLVFQTAEALQIY